MIPQRLVLKNFLCYRQADLDFAGIHLACLAGANGAGKSALLDGMTWALWGRARAKRDDELIYLGEKEMAVDFSFQLGSRAYRVLRRRKAGKRGSTLLDLQTRDDGDWQSIGESGVRRTQQRIEEILRLDYDTFANSASVYWATSSASIAGKDTRNRRRSSCARQWIKPISST
jgi:exonuclease SbcC